MTNRRHFHFLFAPVAALVIINSSYENIRDTHSSPHPVLTISPTTTTRFPCSILLLLLPKSTIYHLVFQCFRIHHALFASVDGVLQANVAGSVAAIIQYSLMELGRFYKVCVICCNSELSVTDSLYSYVVCGPFCVISYGCVLLVSFQVLVVM